MEFCKLLKDYRRVYLTGLHNLRIGKRLRHVDELGIPSMEYIAYSEYLVPNDTMCIVTLTMHDSTAVLRVDRLTFNIDAIYIVRSMADIDPLHFLDPDERIGRVRLFDIGYGVYTAWRTTHEVYDAHAGSAVRSVAG